MIVKIMRLVLLKVRTTRKDAGLIQELGIKKG